MLFKELQFFDHKFPEPQYLGAKYTLREWVNQFIPDSVSVVLDAFSGSQSIAYWLKQMGLKVITNDFLNFNHQIGLALIENSSEQLLDDDVHFLFKYNTSCDFQLIQTLYSGVFFEKNETIFLDNFRANAEILTNPYKKALALAVMNRSMTRKVTMGHFCHTQALNYADDPMRIKRNRSLVRPLCEIFLDILPQYNQAVFDNSQQNTSYHQNILDLLPKLQSIDLVYFDPPYCNSHADYQSFYHLLETYTEYWKDKSFINGIRRYEPKRHSGFDKKGEVIHSFLSLFEFSNDIPHWLISYNDRSYPDIETLVKMISKFRHVSLEEKTYKYGRGGKGSVAGSKEVLLVCKPVKKSNPLKKQKCKA